MFGGLVAYRKKVKRINRGYITRYTIKLRDQVYSNIIIGGIRIIIVITVNYLQFIDMGGLECTTGHKNDTRYTLMAAGVKYLYHQK